MLDTFLNPYLKNPLKKAGEKMTAAGVTPNHLTMAIASLALVGCFAVGFHGYSLAILMILLYYLTSRVKKLIKSSGDTQDFLTYIDTIIDPLFFAALGLFFAMGQEHHHLASAFLIFSFFAVTIVSSNKDDSSAPFYHPKKFGDALDMSIFFVLVCILPNAFSAFAVLFAIACWIAVAARLLDRYKVSNPSSSGSFSEPTQNSNENIN